MSKTPLEVVNTVPKKKILDRLKTCAQYYFDNIEPKYAGVHLNLKLLRHAVESYFLDIDRMKAFHGIEYADCHKRAAFSMCWITRIRPIQLHTDVNMTEGLIVVNEIYALAIGLGHLELDMGNISGEYIKNLLYILHFRSPSPEILSSLMYVLECAVNKKEP